MKYGFAQSRRWRVSLVLAVLAMMAASRSVGADELAMADPNTEHPLMPALRIAYDGLKHIDANIQDYSATVIKRERLAGELSEHQYIYVKIRRNPFSVYMYFLGPDDLKGRECLYIQGQNDNKLRAHEGTGIKARFGMVSLEPNSALAMKGQRYPITMIGVRTLTTRLVEVAENDKQYGECDVKIFKGAKINGRNCTCIQATHPVPRKQFRFHLARVFIDDEIQVPIRYAAYLWPRKTGGAPVLDEEYTYLNMKLNNGFTDEDFDHRNANYRFVKK